MSTTVRHELIDDQTLDWLLDPADPALRAKVLVDLLDRPEDDPDVINARANIPNQPYAAAALSAILDGRIWDNTLYIKYRGPSWTMAHLSEIGVSGDHPAIQQGIEYILSSTKLASKVQPMEAGPLAGYQPVCWLHPIACLTARMVTVLTRYGLADHEITRGARATLLHLHQPDSGFNCRVMDYSLLPSCFMTVPEVLKCWLTIPQAERVPQEDDAIGDLVVLLRKHYLYRYVPVHGREFVLATDKMSINQKLEVKQQWIADGKLDERKPKAGWLKYSFPHSYNTDLLEVLLVLGEARRQFGEKLVPHDEILDDALQVLLDSRTKDGRWKMTGGLNGKMWANLDQKGKPSPWITYRALKSIRLLSMLNLN